MALPAVVRRLVEEFSGRRPTRTKSLIVTVFGDIVSAHGGAIWLGSLIRALAPLGIDERLVRTSVFRLVKEGWLESEQIGRRSYYRFSEYGRHEYERAAKRIYALEESDWNGSWLILVPLDLSDRDRERFRASLHWQGFRSLSAGMYARPGSGQRALRDTLAEFDVRDRVMVMQATTDTLCDASLVRQVVRDNWHLDALADEYLDFMRRYRPLLNWLDKGQLSPPEAAFIARVLLLHDYRRILLQDTELPNELLPPRWSGADARRLTGQIYQRLAQRSAEYVCAEMESTVGPLPQAEPVFWSRFAAAQ